MGKKSCARNAEEERIQQVQILDRETMPLTLEMVLLLRDELWLDFTTVWPWNQTLIDQHIADNMSYLGVANGFEGGNRSQHTVLTKVQATDRVFLLRDVTITVGVGQMAQGSSGVKK